MTPTLSVQGCNYSLLAIPKYSFLPIQEYAFGFANLGSLAGLSGAIASFGPNKRDPVAKSGLRAVFFGSLANMMSAAEAGFC